MNDIIHILCILYIIMIYSTYVVCCSVLQCVWRDCIHIHDHESLLPSVSLSQAFRRLLKAFMYQDTDCAKNILVHLEKVARARKTCLWVEGKDCLLAKVSGAISKKVHSCIYTYMCVCVCVYVCVCVCVWSFL